MNAFADAAAAEVPQTNFLSRLRHWALFRLFAEAILIVVAVAVGSRVLSTFVPPSPSPLHAEFAMGRNLLVAVLLLGSYALIVRLIERRSAGEIALSGGLVQLPAGAVTGIGLMASVYLILWAMKLAAFGPGAGFDGIAAGAIVAFLAAMFEELLFRAILFRIVEQSLGTGAALLVSAAAFGLIHGFNPGATAFSDAAIAIEAGLMLAIAYALTRNLWFAIGIHAGWNFAEGNLFGAQVSGLKVSSSLVHATLTGSVRFTGGDFGPEASIVSICVCSFAALVFAVLVIRRNHWQRRTLRFSLA